VRIGGHASSVNSDTLSNLIAPQFVKPYVKSNKNDARDAEAICDAVYTARDRSSWLSTPVRRMRFVDYWVSSGSRFRQAITLCAGCSPKSLLMTRIGSRAFHSPAEPLSRVGSSIRGVGTVD
jgi:hypothetical protein